MHSILPPSSAKEWGACTGWLPLNVVLPPEGDSEESRLGTAVHELAAIILASGMDTWSAEDWLGTPMSNGVPVDEEMFECAMTYVTDVLNMYQLHPNGDLRIEQTIECKSINEYCFGTPDATLWDSERNVLFVWDYKHGFDPVDVYQNTQLVTYVSGLLDLYRPLDTDVTVVMRIVQPRAFHREGGIREWTVNASALRGPINLLANAAGKNVSGQGECQTGEHCKYCKARHTCEAAIKAGVSLFEVVSQPIPMEMSNAAMGVQYSLLKRAEAHIKSLLAGFEAQLMSKLTHGEIVEGWELKDSFGKRKWNLPDEDIIFTGDAMEIDLRTPVNAISPAQAEKKGVPKDVVAMFAHSPKTGVALVKSDMTAVMRKFL